MEQQTVESGTSYDAEELQAKLLGIVLELAPKATGQPMPSAKLVDDLGYHSLALLELAFALEDEFNLLPLDESAARRIHTVGDVVAHVLTELKGAGRIH